MKLIQSMLLLCLSTSVFAQTLQRAPPPPPVPPVPPYAEQFRPLVLVVRPSLQSLEEAYATSGLGEARARMHAAFDIDGAPVEVELYQSTGNEGLDRALVAWVWQTRIAPGRAVSGYLPFQFGGSDTHQEAQSRADDEDAAASPPPSAPVPARVVDLQDLKGVGTHKNELLFKFIGAGFRESTVDVELEHDSDGRVLSARLMRLSPSESLDLAIMKWVSAVKVQAVEAGTARLVFRMLMEPGLDSADAMRVYLPEPRTNQLFSAKAVALLWDSMEMFGSGYLPNDGVRVRVVRDASGQMSEMTILRGSGRKHLDDFLLKNIKRLPFENGAEQNEIVVVELFPNGAVRTVEAEGDR